MKKITFHIPIKQDAKQDEWIRMWAQGYQAAPGLVVAKAHTIYHGWDGKSLLEQDGAWFVYHLNSGATVSPKGFDTRKHAQRFAELAAPCAHWTQDKASIEAAWKESGVKVGDVFQAYYRQIVSGEDAPPEEQPEDAPRPLPVATIPGGFTVRGKELARALKGTNHAVKFGGVIVNPSTLREIARLHPLLEIRPARGELRLATPNGRNRIRLLDGAGVKDLDAAPSADIRPTVRLAAAIR